VGDYQGTLRIITSSAPDLVVPVTLKVVGFAVSQAIPPPPQNVVVGSLDSSKDTVVLTHGLSQIGQTDFWTGTGDKEASSLVQRALGSGSAKVNIVQYVWQGALQVQNVPTGGDYVAAFNQARDAGFQLANVLIKALGVDGTYSHKIHFIGHSLGTVVNTYAAEEFLKKEPNIQGAQFTALDRPDHINKIPHCSSESATVFKIPTCYGSNFRDLYGFDSDFFAAHLARFSPRLKIDNYYSLTGEGVGDVANGPTYNQSLDSPGDLGALLAVFGSDPGVFNDHSGVQQWYRWTIFPHDPLPNGPSVCNGKTFSRNLGAYNSSLNPCETGWAWSVLSNSVSFPSNNGSGAGLTKSGILTPTNQLDTDPLNHGCTVNGTTINCTEASSPYTAMAITIPPDGITISFTYNFANSGDGDYASVAIDNSPIWILGGSSAAPGIDHDTGPIPIASLTGNRVLTVSLYGVGGKNFGFTIKNITIQSKQASPSSNVFQSTLPPSPGLSGSIALSNRQFLGNYFVVNSPTHVDSIGTYAQAADGGTIFGAIVAVPSLAVLPSGTPFDGTTKASAVLRLSTTSGVVTAPVDVNLSPGVYAVVFGTGYYGATSTSAFAALSNGGSAGLPADWRQVSWGDYCNGGSTACWTFNSSSSQYYFVLTGTASAGPVPAVSGISPGSAIAGGQSITLTVSGSGFVNGSTVQWNSTALTTSYVSSTQVTAVIPGTLLANVGSANVSVVNPGGGQTGALPFLINSPTALAINGGLAHFAVGQNWTTGVFIFNTSSSSARYSITFYDDNGSPIVLPFSFGATARLSGVLQPNGSSYFEASNPSRSVTAGWAQINADQGIVVHSLFRNSLNNTQYEAAVPSNSGTRQFEFPFDATNFSPSAPFYTGVAVANLDANSQATLSCTARDPSGNLIANGLNVPPLRPLGHWAGFQFPRLTGLRGTVECNSTTDVAPVALRFIGTDSFSSLPIIAKPLGGRGGSGGLAHFAVGSNWTTGIFVVNTGSSAAQYALSFYDDNGSPTTLPFPSGSTSRLTGTIAPNGSAYLEAANPSAPLVTGWVQILADSNIVVQSLFRNSLNRTQYEAAVPSSTGSREFQFPFDATNFAPGIPFYTGIAVANLDPNGSANITCTARNQSGATIVNGLTVPTLRPLGHWAGFQFPLLGGLRGTIDCASSTNVAPVALRFIGTDSFSSLPIVNK